LNKRFKPGDHVSESGIYRVYHDTHRLMHEATLLRGGRFPLCRECRSAVYFELARQVKDSQIIPRTSNVLLEDWPDDPEAMSAIG
jgi:hypothetical protein